jgi:hypothetical protein
MRRGRHIWIVEGGTDEGRYERKQVENISDDDLR